MDAQTQEQRNQAKGIFNPSPRALQPYYADDPVESKGSLNPKTLTSEVQAVQQDGNAMRYASPALKSDPVFARPGCGC